MMKKETILFENIRGGTTNPLFRVIATDFGVICESRESEAVCWHDYMGSVGRFYSLFGYSEAESQRRENVFIEKILLTNEENVSEIRNEIIDLLKIFPSNNYGCNYLGSANENRDDSYNFFNIVFPLYDSSISTEAEVAEDCRIKFNKAIEDRGNYLPPENLYFLSAGFYNGMGKQHLLATKHENRLNKNRVDYFKNEILKGERPPVIVLCASGPYGCDSAFIIDGHHKAKAYLDLEINPAIIEITGPCENSSGIISDLKRVSKILYKDQMIYLIKRAYADQKIIEEIYNDETLRQYCLDGETTEYYPNGNLKLKGNYVKSKPDGVFVWYYPDGSLEKRIKYKMGQFKCMYEHYFHDGRLLWRGDENGVIEQYDIYGNKLK